MKIPNIEMLRNICSKYNMSINDEELIIYLRIIRENFIQSYEYLDKLIEPEITVKYPRTPGYRPNKNENPLNAWYWKTKVSHEKTGKLLGKNIALKDNISLAGVPMTVGTNIMNGFIPEMDATIVTRILDEAGNIAGKAVCESLCCAGSSFTADTGPVLNPHNTLYSAGGSSSGSAALVASGDVDMAIGCDQTGSIRIPSSWCGIYGLKPSWGLVPYTGIFPVDVTIDHVGPMARTVEDLALLLEVIAGSDGLDPRQYNGRNPKLYSKCLNENINGLKIGIVREGFGWEDISESDVDRTVKNSALLFKECGAVVNTVSIPEHLDGSRVADVINIEGTTAQMVNGFSQGTSWKGYYQTQLLDAYASGLKSRSDELAPITKEILFTGEAMRETYNGHYYAKAQNLGRQVKAAYDKMLAKYDVLIMPTTPFKATKLPKEHSDLATQIKSAMGMDINTGVFNVTGHPALSVPCGYAENGLPIGMMLIGRYGDDEKLLLTAYNFEKITNGQFCKAVK